MPHQNETFSQKNLPFWSKILFTSIVLIGFLTFTLSQPAFYELKRALSHLIIPLEAIDYYSLPFSLALILIIAALLILLYYYYWTHKA